MNKHERVQDEMACLDRSPIETKKIWEIQIWREGRLFYKHIFEDEPTEEANINEGLSNGIRSKITCAETRKTGDVTRVKFLLEGREKNKPL